MANETINQQIEDGLPTNDDFLLMWDVTTGKTKKVSVENVLLKALNGDSSWAWQDWIPSYTNFNAGNGTLSYAKYLQIGKTVFFRIRFILGSTSAVTGGLIFSLPVTASANHNSESIGQATISDIGTRDFACSVVISGTTGGGIIIHPIVATYLDRDGTDATKPMIWAAGDIWSAQGMYEAA